jgi:hypothetical protein
VQTLIADDGLFEVWGIDSSTDLDELRRSFTVNDKHSPRPTRPVIEFKSESTAKVIEFKDPEARPPKKRSWISSSFNDGDVESEDELDDSVYTLLNDDEDCQFRKLSLHDILVEEELSFRKSLVWNDEERSDN